MNTNDYTTLCGQRPSVIRPLPPFDTTVIAFLSDLSSALLSQPKAKAYPDIVTFAFFIRQANIRTLQAQYPEKRIGRGYVFHIAPSNVPINFAYSLLTALLAGNHSTVKASSQGFAQTEIVCHTMQTLLSTTYPDLATYVHVVTYPRERNDITADFSKTCDARLIWGGDETVRRIRLLPTQPRCIDIPFSDRYSLLVLQAGPLATADDKELAKVAKAFYNDTYLTSQTACTAPRLLYWLGTPEEVARAQAVFWQAVSAYTRPRYATQAVVQVDKLTAGYAMAMSVADTHLTSDEIATRVKVATLPENLSAYTANGGFFVEYESQTLTELPAILTPKFQTLTYYGLDKATLTDLAYRQSYRGIDRIVPLGHSMDFSLHWDGFDLIRTLSRTLS